MCWLQRAVWYVHFAVCVCVRASAAGASQISEITKSVVVLARTIIQIQQIVKTVPMLFYYLTLTTNISARATVIALHTHIRPTTQTKDCMSNNTEIVVLMFKVPMRGRSVGRA